MQTQKSEIERERVAGVAQRTNKPRLKPCCLEVSVCTSVRQPGQIAQSRRRVRLTCEQLAQDKELLVQRQRRKLGIAAKVCKPVRVKAIHARRSELGIEDIVDERKGEKRCSSKPAQCKGSVVP